MVRAAGGVISRKGSKNRTEILLVHRPRYQDWTFPKGKVQQGESEQECAVREVEEETGLKCRLMAELSDIKYIDRRGRSKTVRYWTMAPESGKFKPNDEVDQVRWMTLAQAAESLSYERDLALLDELADTEVQAGSGLLVRHAWAGSRKDWQGEDNLRPLDEKGRLQALELAQILVRYPIERLYSSPSLRCIQTIEPLGELLGLDITPVLELAEGATRKSVKDLLAGQTNVWVACTHGDVMASIIGDECSAKKGSVWVVDNVAGKLEPVRHILAPEPIPTQ